MVNDTMIGYTIELKSNKDITELVCELEDGSLGQDGIAYNGEMLSKYGFFNEHIKVVGIHKIDDYTSAYLIESSYGRTYIHLDWVSTFEGSKALTYYKSIAGSLLQVSRKYVLHTDTGELVLKSSLPICYRCNESIASITTTKGKHICNSCRDKAIKINNYSYVPELSFKGKQLNADKGNEVWYGIENEVSTDKDKLSEVIIDRNDELFLKHDSSITGGNYNVEIVSHPHSFKYLMSKGSWVEDMSILPTNRRNENGMHIHISRTAFVDDKHYSLFYFLLHNMVDICTKVGGRGLTDYCKLAPTGKVHTKKIDDVLSPKGRSVFLNEKNTDTVEARFFKATTNPNSIKANIQLLESVIKYTKYHKKTVSVKGWFQYITKKSSKYKQLLEVVDSITDKDREIKVIYKEPKREVVPYNKVTLGMLPHVTEIISNVGVSHVGEIYKIHPNDTIIDFKNTHGDVYLIHTYDIESIVVEEE